MSPIYTLGKLVLKKEFTWNETVWNPSMISTALWLDAADSSTVTTVSGAVSQWSDKSGNGRDASQPTSSNRPSYETATLNGKAVLGFNGTNSWIRTTSFALSQPVSYFIVCKSNKTTGSSGDRSYVFDGFNVINSALGRHLFALYGDSTGFNSIYGGSWLSSGAAITTNPLIGSLVFNDATSRASINGGTSSAVGGAGANSLTQGLTIGVNYLNNGDWLNGQVAEFIVVASDVSIDIRQKTEGYLAHKWGLTASLPGGHPYKTVGPTP